MQLKSSIFKPGKNCWNVFQSERAAFLIDGDNYYRALRESILKARHSILISGWDIHSEVKLIRGEKSSGLSQTLADVLAEALQNNPELQIFLLEWDFSIIYAGERELMPGLKLRWNTNERLHFHMDSYHPPGASHHQKIIVIDDKIAYSGGLDITSNRWDTRKHEIYNPLRLDPWGKPYSPFHDIQLLMDGEAAKALGKMFRLRWKEAAEDKMQPPLTSEMNMGRSDPWPASVVPDLTEINIGLSRTFPTFKDRNEIREVESLYLDSIKAAEKIIYIENQYLSSRRIVQALTDRLKESEGPEIIMILPKAISGWLEHNTMDLIRIRLLNELYAADHYNRLGIFFVRLSRDPYETLMIHSKLMIIDDVFVRIASSNLSNRSMGMDTECDASIQAKDDKTRNVIAYLRQSLLAEHLDSRIEKIEKIEKEKHSVLKAIKELGTGSRTLVKLKPSKEEDTIVKLPEWLSDDRLLDPEKPVTFNEMLKIMFLNESSK